MRDFLSKFKPWQLVVLAILAIPVLVAVLIIPGGLLFAGLLLAGVVSFFRMKSSDGRSKVFWTLIFILSIVFGIILCCGSAYYVVYAFFAQ